MTIWKMQEAKVQLSALVQLAINKEPQFITHRGKPAVVVISQKEYDLLLRKSANKVKL